MLYDLFNLTEIPITLPVVGQLKRIKAVPSSGGMINILKDFDWKNRGEVDEVPSIIATEYELSWGQSVTNIQRIFDYANNITDPYISMYTTEKTNFTYVFPQLLKGNSTLRKITNKWEAANDTMNSSANFTNFTKDLANTVTSSVPKGLSKLPLGNVLAGTVTNTMGNEIGSNILPGLGHEQIYKYAPSGPNALNITFPLYNTLDVASAFRNYSLVTLLTFQNLKTRTSFISYIPPKIYKIENSFNGGVYMPAAYIEDLTIKSIGTSRILADYGNTLIPEGYIVSITFRELVPQSSNIFSKTIGHDGINNVVEVLNTKSLFEQTKSTVTNAADKLNLRDTSNNGISKFNNKDPQVFQNSEIPTKYTPIQGNQPSNNKEISQKPIKLNPAEAELYKDITTGR